MIIFCHGIDNGIHFGVFSLLFFLALYLFSFCLFSFLFTLFLFCVHPSPAIHRLATNVNEALIATTGVTTLFRDRRRPILGASNHLVFSFVLRGIVLIAGVRKTQATFHRHFIQ